MFLVLGSATAPSRDLQPNRSIPPPSRTRKLGADISPPSNDIKLIALVSACRLLHSAWGIRERRGGVWSGRVWDLPVSQLPADCGFVRRIFKRRKGAIRNGGRNRVVQDLEDLRKD